MSCHVFLSCMHVNLLLGNSVTKIWTRAHPGSRAVWRNICVSKDSLFFSASPNIPALQNQTPNPCRSTMPSHFGWTSTPADSGIMLRLLPRRTCNKDMSNSSSTTHGECGFYLFSQYKTSNHYCADYYSSSLCFSLCPPLLWVSRQLNLRRFM